MIVERWPAAGRTVLSYGYRFHGSDLERLPPSHLFHAVAALRRTGQDYMARMIAAESLART